MEDELYDNMTDDEYVFATVVIEKANDLVKAKNEGLVRDNVALRKSQQKSTERIYELIKQTEDLPKIKKDAHKQAVTDLFGGFNVRQKVWVVGAEYLYNPCTACIEGEITIILDGKETTIRCPKCNGNKKVSTCVYVAKEKRINSIHYEKSMRGIKDVTLISVYLQDDCKYNIDQLYATKEECQAKVGRRNEE
jgi:hypothetical protein